MSEKTFNKEDIVKQSEKFVKKHKKAFQKTYKTLWDEKEMDKMSKERAKNLEGK